MQRFARRLAVLSMALGVATAALAETSTAEAQRRRRPSGRAPAEATQQPAVDPRLDEEARQLFRAGEAAYDAGRYDAALEYFTRAHSLSGRPGLLFNIASASERLRRDDEALRAYEEYLAAVPDAPNREFAEQRIRFLREQIARDARLRDAAQRATAGQELPPPEASDERRAAPSGAERRARRSEGERSEGAPALATPVPPGALAADTVEDDRGGGGDVTGEWWFWTLVGVAVVGAGVGVGAAIAASSDGGSGPPVRGDFGPGGVVVALEAF